MSQQTWERLHRLAGVVGVIGLVLAFGSFFGAWLGVPWPIWVAAAWLGPLLTCAAIIALSELRSR